MWHKEYKDYPIDRSLKKEKVYPQKGLCGCEMHELNGWGNTLHKPLKKKRQGLIRYWLDRLFGG